MHKRPNPIALLDVVLKLRDLIFNLLNEMSAVILSLVFKQREIALTFFTANPTVYLFVFVCEKEEPGRFILKTEVRAKSLFLRVYFIYFKYF